MSEYYGYILDSGAPSGEDGRAGQLQIDVHQVASAHATLLLDGRRHSLAMFILDGALAFSTTRNRLSGGGGMSGLLPDLFYGLPLSLEDTLQVHCT